MSTSQSTRPSTIVRQQNPTKRSSCTTNKLAIHERSMDDFVFADKWLYDAVEKFGPEVMHYIALKITVMMK